MLILKLSMTSKCYVYMITTMILLIRNKLSVLDFRSPQRYYPTRSRLLHWSMARLIIAILFVGLSMVESLSVWRPLALSLYKYFGVLAVILLLVRVANKYLTLLPKPHKKMTQIQKMLPK